MSHPERDATPRDDRTGWERPEAGDGTPQLCKGLYGTTCHEKARPHTGRCEACDNYIGSLGTAGT